MKQPKSWLWFFVLLVLMIAQPNWGLPQRTLVFAHVTVIDATGAPARPDMTVLIVGDRITALGKAGRIRIPKHAQVVDATGKFLIPGLWDMHVHISDKNFLSLFIANGITGVRDMGGSPGEFEQLRQWRQEILNGTLIGPRIVAAGTHVDGPEPIGRPHSINVASEEEARQAVAALKQRGAEFVKVYSMLPREPYFALADEAKRRGLPLAGHVPFSISAAEASDAGQNSMEHLFGVLSACSTRQVELRDEAMTAIATLGFSAFIRAEIHAQMRALDTYDGKKAATLFARLARNETWQVPTLVGWRNLSATDDHPFTTDVRLKYLPATKRESWQAQRANFLKTLPAEYLAHRAKLFHRQLEFVGAMHRAGVGFLAGTDTAALYVFPGFSLHDELVLLVKAGLTPMAVLQAATRNPAKYLGKLDVIGTIERGKIADLVLLEANPLEDIRHAQKIAAVVVGGKLIPKAGLQEMLAKVEAAVGRE